jgi:hypothetical protein
MLFSQRKKLTPVRAEIQREDMDDRLRNKIWSVIQLTLFDSQHHYLLSQGVDPDLLVTRLWLHFFHEPIDTKPMWEYDGFREVLRPWFFKAKWYEVYDLVETLYAQLDGQLEETFSTILNGFLEQEMSAYRLVDGQVAEITSEQEIASIEDAITDSQPLRPVQTHLREALEKLTSREKPDFRNSIKESISAVEALCKIITGDKKATLGQAIKRLKDAGVQLHPTLESAWSKLYGYTSDESGIRHALSDERTVGFSDAKYMLVSCSAFVNHLLDLSKAAGIKLN